jgi:hypothetical protein
MAYLCYFWVGAEIIWRQRLSESLIGQVLEIYGIQAGQMLQEHLEMAHVVYCRAKKNASGQIKHYNFYETFQGMEEEAYGEYMREHESSYIFAAHRGDQGEIMKTARIGQGANHTEWRYDR